MAEAEDPLTAPIVEEVLRVDKRRVTAGAVTVQTRVISNDVTVREELAGTSIRIERMAVDQLVDTVPAIRTEGNRTIVPVVEEVLVKRLRLVGEVHLIREDRVDHFEDSVALRRLDVTVERSGPDQT